MCDASLKALLVEMIAALDAGDSEKYWAAFEAVMKRHEEALAREIGLESQPCSPDDQAQAQPPPATPERKESEL